MNTITIRAAKAVDAPLIANMLRCLADDLGDGDVFASNSEIILRYGFGQTSMFDVVIAESKGKAVGLALYFAHFSTTRANPGVYLQDLWVDPATRGARIGQQLLAEVARNAANTWGATYMKLSVHAGNTGAERFYSRLGFSVSTNETPMTVKNTAFVVLRGAV
jgi:ribosomal protein S18 acetylase RimI-like enzyme